MPKPTFDSNKKDACLRYQTQVKMFGRRHGIEEMLAGEQSDEDVMADEVNMWDLKGRFGNKVVQENMKAWGFVSSSLKSERDVDTLNWL